MVEVLQWQHSHSQASSDLYFVRLIANINRILKRIRFQITSPMYKALISLFLKNPPHRHRPPSAYANIIFFSTIPTKSVGSKPSVETLEYLVKEHQFSLEAARKVSSTISHLKNPLQSDSILSYLREIGFSNTLIEQVVAKVPSILSANLDNTIRPKIKIFRDLGFTPADIAHIICHGPWILRTSVDNRMGPAIMVLKNVLGSNLEIRRLLKASSWFLKYDLEKTMLPNIGYLKSIGISSSQITRYVFSFTWFFLFKPESIQVFVNRVDEMGFDRSSRMFLVAIRVMSSMSVDIWHQKLKLFQSLGFSENDILAVFRRSPQVFTLSEEKLKAMTKLMLSAGKCDLAYIINHPDLLLFSIERRLKPRLEVIDVLEKKNLIEGRPPLTTICKISDQQFLKRFVSPYSDKLLGEVNLSLGSS